MIDCGWQGGSQYKLFDSLRRMKVTLTVEFKSQNIILKSLAHLEPVVNSNIFFPIKVGQDDLQLVISLAGQSVEVFKAKPALSLKMIRPGFIFFETINYLPLAENPSLYSAKVLSK